MGNMTLGKMWKEMEKRWCLMDQEGKEKFMAAFLKDKAKTLLLPRSLWLLSTSSRR